ncbi:alpha/beta fold hydrolase [Sagittula salina]|uniref:Alpha/beta fold hydrolase n=1 Tax=Sagittula salina TaxID=2820268 RepID=A0A940S3B1_9RHOB|nr:alpha/beta fold hydrolase [Sagittula salina]MBP0482570.1 alpha/beta fold hydrolase [Sagittula salina]
MAHLLLIHGAAHGAWCWRAVLPALETLGHTAEAIDLPGHGDDTADIEAVTLHEFGQRIAEHLTRPTILVGHSMGGYSITQAAEIAPDNISRLVYLCAYTPWPDLSLAQMRMQADEQPLVPLIRLSPTRRSFTFDLSGGPSGGIGNFYHDCPEDAVAFARANLCPESTEASNTALDLTERSQSLPRSYIVCNEDRAIPPEFQRRMAARFDARDVHALDSSHSPFFSMPDRLAALLDRIAQQDA